ncbi:hypothetical protein [Daejeonella rubra]|nr:hypothetical protein [Daejeonella rubra]
MSNFKFLQTEWSSIYKKMKVAEERVFGTKVYLNGLPQIKLKI